MGGTISQAANGLGNAIGNAISSPFKSVFGGTCEGVCAGPFDVSCFIEHICVVNLLKLFVICFLLYIMPSLDLCALFSFAVPLPAVQIGSVSMHYLEPLQMLLDCLRNILVRALARLEFTVAQAGRGNSWRTRGMDTDSCADREVISIIAITVITMIVDIAILIWGQNGSLRDYRGQGAHGMVTFAATIWARVERSIKESVLSGRESIDEEQVQQIAMVS
ncbi:hypothetical protein MLD38_038359 [Melastoma candidum]|uniref:Uncharacterized protein n=1 Tax=Melastoma candidum TaxID=119954 RepID=A0ACB9L0Z5_9MYRT|nr:hypothetical protein MLD38_038359 [Melastoma candidum]